MAQVLPSDEDFAAPDWLTDSPASSTQCLPWFFWYLGWKPQEGVSTSAGDGATYPYRVGAELETYGRQELYIEQTWASNLIMPVLMTDTSAFGHPFQRSVLCREEDSTAVEDIDFKVVFGMMPAGGSQMGSGFGGGSSGVSPTVGGRYPFPAGDSADTDDEHDTLAAGGGAFSGNWTSAGVMAPIAPTQATLWALWNGNSLFFRAGQDASGQGPLVAYDAAAGTQSRAWWCTHAAHYAFCAYPVINSGADRVDLYLELWQVKFTGAGATSGTARRVMQQIVDDGARLIDFEQPYFLRVTCDNDATPDVEMNAYIGQVTQTTGPNLTEAQCFKTDVFDNNTFTAGTNVTHTPSTGNVRDEHADKITAFADKSFGWGMGRDRTQDVAQRLDPDATDPPPINMSGIEGVYSVEIKDISAGTVLYRDEFIRSVTGQGAATDIVNPIVGLFGDFGSQANGLFTFDGYSQEFGTGLDEVRRLLLWTDSQTDITAPNDYVTMDYDADDSTAGADQVFNVQRSFIHERPSTQFYNHHRSIEFKPGAEDPDSMDPADIAVGSYEVGIALRGYYDGNRIGGTIAYLSWITDGEETVTSADLVIAARNTDYRDSNPDGSTKQTIIARKRWSTTAEVADFNTDYDLYDGNFHTLDFRAEIYAAATAPNAAAEYHMVLDGDPIEMPDGPNVSDIVSPYPVIEPGPAYYYGTTEGFFFVSGQPEVQITSGDRNFDPFQVKNWVEGTLTADPTDEDPDSQASIAVDGEGSAVGALNTSSGALGISGSGVWDVEVVVTVDSSWPIRRTRFASGHTYTSPAASKARRRWAVIVRGADLAVYQSLQSFYNSHLGMEIPFSFVVPIPDDGTESDHTAEDTETVVAWFASDELAVSEVGPEVYDISFTVEEELVA